MGKRGQKEGVIWNAHSQSSDSKWGISYREPARLNTQVWEVDWKHCQSLGRLKSWELIQGCLGQRILVARAVKGAEYIPVICETEEIAPSLLYRSVESKWNSLCGSTMQTLKWGFLLQCLVCVVCARKTKWISESEQPGRWISDLGHHSRI